MYIICHTFFSAMPAGMNPLDELDKEKIAKRLSVARAHLAVRLSNPEIAAELKRRTGISLEGESIRRYFLGKQWQLAAPLVFKTICEILQADPLWVMLNIKTRDYLLTDSPTSTMPDSSPASVQQLRIDAISARLMTLDAENLGNLEDYLALLELKMGVSKHATNGDTYRI